MNGRCDGCSVDSAEDCHNCYVAAQSQIEELEGKLAVIQLCLVIDSVHDLPWDLNDPEEWGEFLKQITQMRDDHAEMIEQRSRALREAAAEGKTND